MSTTTLDRLRELLEPVVSTLGVDLEEVSLTPAGKRRVLRVMVAADGGVDLDKVAEVSRAVSEVLDPSDVLGSLPYLLEVTTPGVDRPLTLERHWRRAADRLVLVQLHDGGTVTGRIGASDAEGVELDVDGTPRRLTWDEVAKAVVQVEFNRKGKDSATTAETEEDDEDDEDTGVEHDTDADDTMDEEA
ncbi:ribosome maturation factor RimP [Embleya scabrispora]|uniref:Ribosome maturation factor RimP n=1 Tax=Embleya scabrispora TaxID=159449 RepID=A0A1T3P234_9ACTN|nr:ribosome maturation factor RimP [Embleya scabrispora]OPC83138.1 ribosome maturation factor RimP [Embleya scabrispora]